MRPLPHLIGWYYRRAGHHVGPLTPVEIAQLLDSGELRPTDMLVEIAPAAEGGSGVRYDYQQAAVVAKVPPYVSMPSTVAMSYA